MRSIRWQKTTLATKRKVPGNFNPWCNPKEAEFNEDVRSNRMAKRKSGSIIIPHKKCYMFIKIRAGSSGESMFKTNLGSAIAKVLECDYRMDANNP